MIAHSLKRFALACIFSTMVITFAHSAESRGVSGCPPGVDATKYVCLTREEAQKLKLDKLDLQDKVIDLREELAKARLNAPTGLLRYVRPWATVGIEKGLNNGKYEGYATGGLTFGRRVNIWAGVWGTEPEVGVGWNF